MYAHHMCILVLLKLSIYLSIYLSINQSINQLYIYSPTHGIFKIVVGVTGLSQHNNGPTSSLLSAWWPKTVELVQTEAIKWGVALRLVLHQDPLKKEYGYTMMGVHDDIIFVAMLSCACKNDIIILHKST